MIKDNLSENEDAALFTSKLREVSSMEYGYNHIHKLTDFEAAKALIERERYFVEKIVLLTSLLSKAKESMDERREYCTMWEWKHRERWDNEDKMISDAVFNKDNDK